jgi:hypothetical protein
MAPLGSIGRSVSTLKKGVAVPINVEPFFAQS